MFAGNLIQRYPETELLYNNTEKLLRLDLFRCGKLLFSNDLPGKQAGEAHALPNQGVLF